MTPRTGLYVALGGLVMFVLCFTTLCLLAVLNTPNPDVGDGLMRLYLGFVIALDLGSILGLIVVVVGLVMAGVLALTKQRSKPT